VAQLLIDTHVPQRFWQSTRNRTALWSCAVERRAWARTTWLAVDGQAEGGEQKDEREEDTETRRCEDAETRECGDAQTRRC
jgi:hypothetical protein